MHLRQSEVRNTRKKEENASWFAQSLFYKIVFQYKLIIYACFYLCLSIYIHLSPSLTLSHEKAVAPHSSTLAWKIPWMEEPGRLQSMGSLRVGHDWATSVSLFTFMHWRRKWQPTPVFLPGESQGQRSLVGCSLWGHTGSHRVRHDWSDLAAAAATALFHTHTHKHTHPSLPHSLFFSLLCSSFFSYLD